MQWIVFRFLYTVTSNDKNNLYLFRKTGICPLFRKQTFVLCTEDMNWWNYVCFSSFSDFWRSYLQILIWSVLRLNCFASRRGLKTLPRACSAKVCSVASWELNSKYNYGITFNKPLLLQKNGISLIFVLLPFICL